MNIQNVLIGLVAMLVSVSAMADNPTISGVMVQQRWPWSRLVDIDYVLTCDPGESMDIVVEAYDGSERLDVPEASLSGDLSGVQRGARRIVWDPTMTAYTNNGVIPEFRVALTPHRVPLYMIVDLNTSAGEAGQFEYVYESDLTNGLWGAWVRNPVTNREVVVESVVWTGVTTNDIYKTDKLVLRRISRGTFDMGEEGAELSTMLTKDFYVGVFQVTSVQRGKILGLDTSAYTNPTLPVTAVTYDIIRGATNSVPAINWPGTGTSVELSSYVGKLREKTGLVDFDLPTEAQWEYACRAETTTYYNDGIVGSSASRLSQMNELGWHAGNSENKVHPVGQKIPNAWGLYDMHGNILEWCLDWYVSSLTGGEDPQGPEFGVDSDPHRILRGGSWGSGVTSCHSAYRGHRSPSPPAFYLSGFRLVRNLP